MKTINRYEIIAELGRGGMATVYHAHDPRFKRDVAIKVLPAELLNNPLYRTRFQREAEVIAGLEHPAIVPVYDVGEEGGQPFLVMRYLPGGDLFQRLAAQQRLPLAQVYEIVERLAGALDSIHARQIIHRDIKPANVLFDAQGRAYLTDFGIAKLLMASDNLTKLFVVGTVEYMSPEQSQGSAELDGRSDIYSLGMVLFHALTGRLPFHAEDDAELALARLTQPVPSVRAIQPDLPEACDTILARAMAVRAADRYATAGALAADLAQIVGAPARSRDDAAGLTAADTPEPAGAPAGDLLKTAMTAVERLVQVEPDGVIYAVAGGAAFGLLSWIFNIAGLPARDPVAFYPPASIPALVGLVFGPAAGLLAGAAGGLLGDVLSAYSFDWSWVVGAGLIGFVAGLARLAGHRAVRTPRGYLVAGAFAAAATFAGLAFPALIVRPVIYGIVSPEAAAARWLGPAALRALTGGALAALGLFARNRWRSGGRR